METTIKAIVDTTEGVTASVIWRGNGFDLSWRSSEPIDVTSYEQRRATIAQRRNLVARLRKFEVAARTTAGTAMSFAGFTRESANVDFTQKLKNDSGVVLKPCKR